MHHLNTPEPEVRSYMGQPFSVADYVQLAGMARRSVELTVKNDSVRGTIVIREGQSVWARDQDGEGLDAFGRMVMASEAEVECRPLAALPGPPNLTGSVDELLLEAARLADEQMREQALALDSAVLRTDAVPAVGVQDSATVTAFRPAPPGLSVPPVSTPVAVANGSKLPSSVPPPMGMGATGASALASTPALEARTTLRPVSTTPPEPMSLPSTSRPPLRSRPAAVAEPGSVALILALAPSLKGAVRAASDGRLLEVGGELDAETASAVAALAVRSVLEAAESLALGALKTWYITLGDATWYVVHDGSDMLVATGESAKNPGSVLQKIVQGCRR